MASNYPASLDTTTELPNDRINATLNTIVHATHHNNISDVILAIETELGLSPSSTYSDVKARVTNAGVKNPSGNQTFRPSADVPSLTVRAAADQLNQPLVAIQSAGGSNLGTWDRLGEINAVNFVINTVALATSDLADVADLIFNPSDTITTPNISGGTLTGVPTAPTPSAVDDSTKIATTAFVKDQLYAILASQAFTGTTQAPTQAVGTDNTRIATTAYVLDEIPNRIGGSAPIGTVSAWSATSAPANWVLCDDSAISRATYSELYTLIGTTYGVGDGSTTFNVPDLRGRHMVGKGTNASVDALGESDGIAVATRRPTHSHSHSLSGGGGGHSHSAGSSSGVSHSHSITGVSGASGVASGDDLTCATTGSVGTSSDGDHSHSHTINGNNHGHAVSAATVGIAGISEKSAYIVFNYMIKVL